jgi:nucleotide-binding universal stress UspA family protein
VPSPTFPDPSQNGADIKLRFDTTEGISRFAHRHCLHGRLADAIRQLVGAMRSWRTHVLIGDQAPKIACGKPEGVDSILMGTRGMGALGDLALCLRATKAIHSADVPVLS